MYATATFPYVVTTIFFIRSVSLDGAMEGFSYMFHPDVSLCRIPLNVSSERKRESTGK